MLDSNQDMKVLIFTKQQHNIAQLPQRPGIEVQHVIFETAKLADLMLIAEYRIINFPTTLIIDDRGNVLLKVKSVLSEGYIDNLLARN